MGYQRLDSWKRSKQAKGPMPVGRRPPRNLLEAIHWRSQNQKVSLFIITGKRGDGKSNNALVYAKLFDPSFTIKERLFFKLDDLLAFIDKIGISPKPIWIVLDEAGYNLDSYKWHDKMALTFKYLAEMGRVSKINMILTLPTFVGINKATRRLCDFLMVCWRQGKGRIYILGVDSFDGKQKRFSWLDATVEKCEDELWSEYEKVKNVFWMEAVKTEIDKHKETKPTLVCSVCGKSSWQYLRQHKMSECRTCGNRTSIS